MSGNLEAPLPNGSGWPVSRPRAVELGTLDRRRVAAKPEGNINGVSTMGWAGWLFTSPAFWPTPLNLLRWLVYRPLYELAEVEGGRDAFPCRQFFQALFKSLWDGYARPLLAHVLSLSFLHAPNSIRRIVVDNQTIFVGCDLFWLTIYDERRISN
jgi:hypothetical protein